MLDKAVPCLVCGEALSIRMSQGRKSGKPFIMLICPTDGRHFRGFVTYQPYVRDLLDLLEASQDSVRREGL